jgi:formate dehydrogenase major subunit
VAGLANVWGYGAMTNSMNDIRNAKCVMVIGENVCTSHPIAMQHILTAKEVNKAPFIVVDPRFTQTAGLADYHVRLRSGTDIALIYGMVHVILKNGWEDKKMLAERTYGWKDLVTEMGKYDLPDPKTTKSSLKDDLKTVSDITGVAAEDVIKLATLMAKNRPSTVIWAMGGTQHNHGTAVVRSYCILQLVLGNMGVSGGGTNVFRGHDNVQGATDLGVTSDSLPGYYGVAESAFKHWAGIWDVDLEWIKGRFTTVKKMQKVKKTVDGKEVEVEEEVTTKLMEKPGLTVARWYEAVGMDVKDLGQPTNVKAAIYWGHSSNSESQMDRVKTALEKVELLVDIDPFITTTTILPDRTDNVYMLPAASSYEQNGSVTNSNRGIQWRTRVVPPVFESKGDIEILMLLANHLGFGKEFAKNKTGPWKQLPEDITREWNMGMLSVGMRGQTPERMKRQQKYADTFDINHTQAVSGPLKGEQWGLPWPCWSDKHPGTAILYRVDVPVMQGGGGFRARWGEKAPDGETLMAADGSAPKNSPEGFRKGYDGVKAFATDTTGKAIDDALAKGINPYGNGRARISAFGIPDPVPTHREPIHSPRPDLITKWPTYDDVKDHYRVPTLFKTLQKPEWAKKYPIILSSGRQVEFEGGGASERNSWWLVELQPEMYVEMHPKLAADTGVKHGDWVWVYSPEDLDDKPSRIHVKAKVTRRVPPDMVYLPFHWAGAWDGKSLGDKFPEGMKPYGIGESANVVTNYGYDRVTQMQETKTGLCRIEKA